MYIGERGCMLDNDKGCPLAKSMDHPLDNDYVARFVIEIEIVATKFANIEI